MEAPANKSVPCIYVAACGDCDGFPDAIAVHLLSGEEVRVEHVVDVRVNQDEMVFQPLEGPAQAFPRSEVYFAGCARCLPPFLS